MAGSIPREHDQNDDMSGTSRPHVRETDQQSQLENSSNVVAKMKQVTIAEAHTSTFKSEELCKKKTLKITDIDGNVFMKICGLLNIKRVLGGDYYTLAAKLGYKVIDIQLFSQEANPTKSLLLGWSAGKGNMAEKILNISKEMDRDDIVQLLKKEFENCNCQKCASLC